MELHTAAPRVQADGNLTAAPGVSLTKVKLAPGRKGSLDL